MIIDFFYKIKYNEIILDNFWILTSNCCGNVETSIDGVVDRLL